MSAVSGEAGVTRIIDDATVVREGLEAAQRQLATMAVSRDWTSIVLACVAVVAGLLLALLHFRRNAK